MRHAQTGLSLVEVVVGAAMLLTVLAVTAGLLSALSTTRTTVGTADAVSGAQQGAELVRGAWGTDPALYRGTCFNRAETLAAERVGWPPGVQVVEVRNLDVNGNSTGTVELNRVEALCTQSSASLEALAAPPLRQVTVVGQGVGDGRILTVRVARP